MSHVPPGRLAFLCVAFGLGLMHLLALFSAGAYIATLPQVAAGLTVPPSFGTWTQTDFMIGLAVGVPLARACAVRWGDAWVFRTATAGFAAASVACALAPGLGAFVLCRFVLGVAGGLSLPAGQRLFARACLARGTHLGFGFWGLIALSPFSLGTAFGGWLADEYGWRALFHLNVPLALLALLLTARAWRDDPVAPADRPFGWLAYLLLAGLLLGTQTLLNLGNDVDWLDNAGLTALLVLLLLLLAGWSLRVWLGPGGSFDWALLASRNFLIGLAGLVLGFLCFQGLLSLLIIQLQLAYGYSSGLAGLVFLPMALAGLPVAFAVNAFMRPRDARWLASVGLLGLAAIYAWYSQFDQPQDFAALSLPKLLEGVCLGLFLQPLTSLMLHDLPPARQPMAGEFASVLRLAAGAIGITLAGVVLYRRSAFHQSRLVEHLAPLDPAFADWRSLLLGHGHGIAQLPARLNRLLAQRANLMAMDDAFLLAAGICLALGLLVWWAHPAESPTARGHWPQSGVRP